MVQARLSMRKIRAARVGAVDRTLECERANAPEGACSSATLGLRPKLGPRFLRCPARNHLRGALKVESGQSPVRLVWASPAISCRSSAPPNSPHSGQSAVNPTPRCLG